MTERNAIDYIVENAVRQVTARANEAIGELVDRINQNPDLPNLPAVELHPPEIVVSPAPVDTRTDALSRAGRSFVGGAVVTALATVGTEIGKLVTDGAFDPLDGSSWKTAGVGLLGALGYAAVAYVQRFLSTPKFR